MPTPIPPLITLTYDPVSRKAVVSGEHCDEPGEIYLPEIRYEEMRGFLGRWFAPHIHDQLVAGLAAESQLNCGGFAPPEIVRGIDKEVIVHLDERDADVTIVFPGNEEELLIQVRPCNADEGYNGSLDIILPKSQPVTCWEGDDMKPSRSVDSQEECRMAKQLVTELPGNYDR